MPNLRCGKKYVRTGIKYKNIMIQHKETALNNFSQKIQGCCCLNNYLYTWGNNIAYGYTCD